MGRAALDDLDPVVGGVERDRAARRRRHLGEVDDHAGGEAFDHGGGQGGGADHEFGHAPGRVGSEPVTAPPASTSAPAMTWVLLATPPARTVSVPAAVTAL